MPLNASNFDEIVQEHGDYILRLCYVYMKKKEYAEDAFQDTLIKIYKSLPSFKGNSTIKTWVSRITINTCKDHLRSKWFKHVFLREEFEFDYYTIDAEIELKEQKSKLSRLLQQLPSTYKDILLLHYYEDLSIREISTILNLSESQVKNRLYRGRNMLKQDWKKEGETGYERT